MESTYQLVISLLVVIVAMAASWFAYDQGYMDPVIEKLGYDAPLSKADWPGVGRDVSGCV